MINYGWLNKAIGSIKPTSVRNNWNNYFKVKSEKSLKIQKPAAPRPLFVKMFEFYLVTQPIKKVQMKGTGPFAKGKKINCQAFRESSLLLRFLYHLGKQQNQCFDIKNAFLF